MVHVIRPGEASGMFPFTSHMAGELMRTVVGWIIFCIATVAVATGQTLTTLVNFDGTNGTYPATALVQGSDGKFYGTTPGGGLHAVGTIFAMAADGTLTSMHSFNVSDGSGPGATLIQATDGDFYGTTTFGGDDSDGTVFRITAQGLLTTMYSFTGTQGNFPSARLIQASDGNFYGLAGAGGSYSGGTVFRLTPGGTLTTLYNFCSQSDCADGVFPFGWLVIGNDGNFYGTTSGGAYSGGTVFKVTPGGTLTTLHNFSGLDGSNPWAGLTLGMDGNFYGTTLYGGPSGYGTVFKITPEGKLTTLHYFCTEKSCPDGNYPYAGLVLASDGNFYGVAAAGGAKQDGTIFEISPQGDMTTLYVFGGADGSVPKGELVEGIDGDFYGTTEGGGVSGQGTVFRFHNAFSPLFINKSGQGTVTSADRHIYCGTTCSFSYNKGTKVTLGAVPDIGYTFTSWEGCDNANGAYCSMSMSAAKNVTAKFDVCTDTLVSLSFNPAYVKGGKLSAGTLTLSGPTPPGGLTVALSSDHPGVAHPPSFVFVPGGKSSVQFAVQTLPVKSNTKVTIMATTTTSSVYGNLTVGTTSLPPALK